MICFRPSDNLTRLESKSESWKQTMPLRWHVFRYLGTTPKHPDHCRQDKTLLPIWVIPSVLWAEWTNHQSYQILQYLLMERTWRGKYRRQRSGTSLKSMLTTTWQLYPKLPMLQAVLKVMLQSTSMQDIKMEPLSHTPLSRNSLSTLLASMKTRMWDWLLKTHTRTSKWESLSHLQPFIWTSLGLPVCFHMMNIHWWMTWRTDWSNDSKML